MNAQELLVTGSMTRKGATPVQGINETGIATVKCGDVETRAIYKLCGSDYSTLREGQTECAVRFLAKLFPFVDLPVAVLRDYTDIGYPGVMGTLQQFVDNAVSAWVKGDDCTVSRRTYTYREEYVPAWTNGEGEVIEPSRYTEVGTWRTTYTHESCDYLEYPAELEERFYGCDNFRMDAIGATLFDKLIGNSDRHGFNWLWRENPEEGERQIVLIDHGAGYVFNTSDWLVGGGMGYADAVSREEIPAAMREALCAIAEADLTELYDCGLDAAQVDAVRNRARKLANMDRVGGGGYNW